MSAALCALGFAVMVPASAQAPSGASALKRTEVTRADVAQPGHEAVVMKVELAPGGHAGRHTHPGNEISYVVDGDCSILIDGQPARKLHGGDAFVVKTGQVHDLRNDGSTPVHLIGVYEVEKGKPLATPAK
jgi:quercetin dioxygenase-like cupin family protein